MQNTLEQILYILSKIFHLPVMLVLLGLLVFILFQCGIFLADIFTRLRKRNTFISTALEKIKCYQSKDTNDREVVFTQIIHNAQEDNNRKIQSAKYCVKIGPTVGLIGTLSPMATALAGLSSGNFTSLSQQMVTAFSTTILGLIVGAAAYTIAHARIQWQRRDRFVLESAAEKHLNPLNQNHEVS